ncbi:MAG: hypothetical protein FJ170_05625 [Gammaproteobacteria bacterium]|nr:hypothetical protein [Gammaproteobacteria bacterium]
MAEIRMLAGLGAIAASFIAMPAQAVPVTLCGTSICYEYDNSVGVNPGIALYGTPTLLSGNTLSFVPTNFNADSDYGSSIPTPTSVAVFKFSRVYTTDGGEVASITVNESGDYQIIGAGAVNANMRLQSVDNVGDGAPTPGFAESTAPQFNWNTSTATGFSLANWSLTGTITPAALFSDLATDVDFSIQNTLQAFAASGNYAFIQKKLALTVTATFTVPVPGAVWLFGSALGMFGFMRRGKAD